MTRREQLVAQLAIVVAERRRNYRTEAKRIEKAILAIDAEERAFLVEQVLDAARHWRWHTHGGSEFDLKQKIDVLDEFERRRSS